MKKRILGCLLAVIMILSPLAVFPAGAANYGSVTLSASDVSVTAGSTTAEVIITVGNIPVDLGLGSCVAHYSVDGGASITSVTKLVSSGSFTGSTSSFMWVDTSSGVFSESFEIAKLTITLPASAKKGDVFNVTVTADSDPDNYLTFVDDVGLGARVVKNGTITVIAGNTPSDLTPVTLSAADVSVPAGSTTAEVVLTVGNIPTDVGLSTCLIRYSVDGGASITSVSKLVSSGLFSGSTSSFMWADSKAGIFASSCNIAKLTVTLPANAKAGDVFNVTLAADSDPANYLGFSDNIGLGATVVRNAKITVTGGNTTPTTTPVTLSAADTSVPAGSQTAEVIVTVGNIPTDLGLGACTFGVSADGGASVAGVSKLVSSGSEQFSYGSYMWADTSTGIFQSSVQLAKITVNLPANAKAGDEFNVTIAANSDPDNYLTFYNDPSTGDSVGLGATVIRSAKITVTEGSVSYSPVTLSAADASVPAGTTTAEVVVIVGNIPATLGLGTCMFGVSADGGASVAGVSKIVPYGSEQFNYDSYMWADNSTGIFNSTVRLAKISVNIPANAKAGDVFNITITADSDPDNYLTFKEDSSTGKSIGLGATVIRNAKITVTGGNNPGETDDNPYDGTPITISGADATVPANSSTADVIVSLGNIPTDLGLSTALLGAAVDGGASIQSITKLVPNGSGQYQNGLLLWADSSTGLFSGSVEFAKVTVLLPAGAKMGDVFNVTLHASEDPDNYLTFRDDPSTGDSVGLGATVIRNAKITVTSAYPPVKLYAENIKVYDTDAEASFDVFVGNITEEVGLCSALFYVEVPGAIIKSIKSKVGGSSQTTELPAASASFIWANMTSGEMSDTLLARVTVSLPSGTKAGDVLPIIIGVSDDPDLYLSFVEENGDKLGLGATAEDGKITVEAHVHSLRSVAGVEPTCTEAGVAAHYLCTICQKTFSDAAGKNEFDPTLAALGHDLVSVARVEPTCTVPGMAAHIECTRCGKLFGDGASSSVTYPATPSADSALVIKAPIVTVSEGTDSVEIEVVADNISSSLGICTVLYGFDTENGALITSAKAMLSGSSQFQPSSLPADHILHLWAGTGSNAVYSGPVVLARFTVSLPSDIKNGDEFELWITTSEDEDNYLSAAEVNGDQLGLGCVGLNGRIIVVQNEVTAAELEIAPLGHTLVHFDEVAARPKQNGNIEYWKCSVCGRYFTDANAAHEISEEETVTEFKFELGDVNGDEKVNNRDVIMLMKIVIAKETGTALPASAILEAADMNGDGKINNRDVIAIMKEVIRRNQK